MCCLWRSDTFCFEVEENQIRGLERPPVRDGGRVVTPGRPPSSAAPKRCPQRTGISSACAQPGKAMVSTELVALFPTGSGAGFMQRQRAPFPTKPAPKMRPCPSCIAGRTLFRPSRTARAAKIEASAAAVQRKLLLCEIQKLSRIFFYARHKKILRIEPQVPGRRLTFHKTEIYVGRP